MKKNLSPNHLLIVGAGIAGLVAGVRSAELGLRVIILEKGEDINYPCNSRQSGGILHIAFHNPKRPFQELINAINTVTDNEAKPELAKALSITGTRLVTWLQEHEIKFMKFNQQEAYSWCMAPPRALRAGIDWKNKGPDIAIRHLVNEFIRLGGIIQFESRVTGLIMQKNKCIGAEGLCGENSQTWFANNVLIADGGFQSNKLLIERYITPNFNNLFQRGARTGCGDGLLMAKAVGAAVTSLDRFYGHLICEDAKSNDNVWPYPEIDALATAGIVVNDSGCRIADEGQNGVFLANEIAKLSNSKKFYAVFDQTIWEGPGTSARIPANPLLEQAGGTILRANSVDELALKMGVPSEMLTQTLQEYNSAISQNALSSLKIFRSEKVKAYEICNLPLMAIPICPAITYTMGGIDINCDAQVLDEKGNAISGLFAAGATTGGIEGGKNSAYVGGLIKSGSFGLLAAEKVATLEGKKFTITSSNSAETTGLREFENIKYTKNIKKIHRLSRFPYLFFLVRYGKSISYLTTSFVFFLVLILAGSNLNWLAIIIAILTGILTQIVLRSWIGMIVMVTELLLPETE
jgi:fumarate reductase flavoprotein subunit